MASKKTQRPLSPHIFIYKMTLTFILSGIHRATGFALYFGTAFLVWYLVALASSAEAFATVTWFMGSPLGLLIMFGYTWALFHHMVGGIKHFMWDFGKAFELDTVQLVSKLAVAIPLILTISTWAIGLSLS